MGVAVYDPGIVARRARAHLNGSGTIDRERSATGPTK
jgi:hypothetical protein